MNLDTGTLRVRRVWDHGERRFIEAKSQAGNRTVPIVARLAAVLSDHRLLIDHQPGRLFPARADPSRPVAQNVRTSRMKRLWSEAKLSGLTSRGEAHSRVVVHRVRHERQTVSTFMGHANISVTLDRYGHLFPGAENEARGLLDRYLDAQGARSGGQASTICIRNQARLAGGAILGATSSRGGLWLGGSRGRRSVGRSCRTAAGLAPGRQSDRV